MTTKRKPAPQGMPPSHPGYERSPLRIGKINGVPVFEIDGEAYCRLAHDPRMGEARRPK